MPKRTSSLAAALKPVLQPVVAVLLALLIGVVIILALGQNPLTAFQSFLLGSFTNKIQFGNMLAMATPLILTGLACAVAFQAGVFSMGAEGQLYMGAFWAAWAGMTFTSLPAPLAILVAILVGALAGGIFGLVPGWMKAKLGVNEVVSTIMLNYVATLLTEYLVNNPFKDPTAGAPMTKMLRTDIWLSHLIAPSSAHTGLFIALVVAVLIFFLVRNTVWGQNARFVGENPKFAEYEGIPVERTVMQTMVLSGMIAGVAGAVQVLGVNHRFIQGFSPSFGFTGVTIALLGRNNPIGTVIAAIFYAVLMNGASIMQRNTAVPYPLVFVLQGTLVLFITAEGLIAWRQRRRKAAQGGAKA